MIDSHLHSKHSHDGDMTLSEIVERAKELNIEYVAVTEHLDMDMLFCQDTERKIKQLDIEQYRKEFSQLRENNKNLAFGLELGYSKKAASLYASLLAKYHFDILINSVHMLDDDDLYFLLPRNQPLIKTSLYRKYLETVLDSITPGYDFDVVGHIGYVARYVTYSDKSLYCLETADLIDEILKRVINTDKTIELNSAVKSLPQVTIPEQQIILRYRELGGENITFSSDAHRVNRIAENYQDIADIAKNAGFRYWTIYFDRYPKRIKI
ncbi:MAG: histidinol-phosphatase HisJ family protein [Christensenellaceae bacterium]|jgi:histidinol-phosphatase (PHP family)|nr:histidinol-phosphatase HisJ family protein [Christensenellaceae bacterium]